MTLIDLTDPDLEIAPIPQSADVVICELTFTGQTVAADDLLEAYVRESIGGQLVGKLTSEAGNFTVNPTTRKVTVRVLDEQSRKWFPQTPITEETRVRTLIFTLLHATAGRQSREWSGELEVKFEMNLGTTNSRV